MDHREDIIIKQSMVFDESDREKCIVSLWERYDVRTICNVIRKIYLLATTDEQKRLCEEAIWMAKRMDLKLRHYNYEWDKGLWKTGEKKE